VSVLGSQPRESAAASILVFDPRGAKEVTQLHAKRIPSLQHKRVALLSNDMWQADKALPALQKRLSELFPETEFLAPENFPRGNSNIDSNAIVPALKDMNIDAAIIGNAACGACSTAVGGAAARLEEAGIPTVVLARDSFADVTKNAFSSRGFDQDAALVTFPIEQFLANGDPEKIGIAAIDFADGLTNWEPSVSELTNTSPPLLEVPADDDPVAFFRETNKIFLNNRCGDGLPLYPPTPSLVRWILRGSDLAPDHVVGKIMPRGGLATVETIAVSLGMAGGRPEYLPVLIAAVEALLNPAMEHGKAQANSGSPFPVVVVNGPMAAQIRLNSGFGLLGPDPRQPAGATIGRALRLLLQNVGGALPGQGTMAAYGSMRFTNAVFAEAEDLLPPGWRPLSSDFGIKAGKNSVTVFMAVGGVSTPRRAISAQDVETEIVSGLHRVAAYMRTPNRDYVVGWATGTPGGLLISPTVAGQLVALGWSKAKLQQFLWETSKVPKKLIEEAGLTEWIRGASHENTRKSPIDPWPICERPEQILVAVAGGDHPSNHFWLPADAPSVSVSTFDTPSSWNALMHESEMDLGPGGSACLV
jgi:hypothetical protein